MLKLLYIAVLGFLAIEVKEVMNEKEVILWVDQHGCIQMLNFFLFLGYLANLYAWLQPCHICTDFGSDSEKIHQARESSVGFVIYLFFKVCADWSFLPVCNCGLSKVNVWVRIYIQAVWWEWIFAWTYSWAINGWAVQAAMLSSSSWTWFPSSCQYPLTLWSRARQRVLCVRSLRALANPVSRCGKSRGSRSVFLSSLACPEVRAASPQLARLQHRSLLPAALWPCCLPSPLPKHPVSLWGSVGCVHLGAVTAARRPQRWLSLGSWRWDTGVVKEEREVPGEGVPKGRLSCCESSLPLAPCAVWACGADAVSPGRVSW